MAFKKPKRVRVTLDTGPGKTEQSHKKDTDMNYILRGYQKTGLIRHAKEHAGKYDDIAVQDFQEAIFIVTNAQRQFDELPSNIRKRFGNNPAEFLEFVQNPENKAEMQTLGILQGNDGIDASGAVTTAPTLPPAEPPAKPETPQTAPPAA